MFSTRKIAYVVAALLAVGAAAAPAMAQDSVPQSGSKISAPHR